METTRRDILTAAAAAVAIPGGVPVIRDPDGTIIGELKRTDWGAERTVGREQDAMDHMLEFCENFELYAPLFIPPFAHVIDDAKAHDFRVWGLDLLSRAVHRVTVARGRETDRPTFAACSQASWRAIRAIILDQHRLIDNGSPEHFDILRCYCYAGVPVFWDQGLTARSDNRIFVVNWQSINPPGAGRNGLNAVIENVWILE